MAITKPWTVTAFLNHINWEAGSWVHQPLSVFGVHIFTLDIPPFSLHIGGWVDAALDALLWAINTGIDALWTAISSIPSALQIMGWVSLVVTNAIAGIVQTIINVVNNTYQTINNVVNNTYQTINNIANNTYQTINNVVNNTYQTIQGVTIGVVNSAIDSALASLRFELNTLITFAGAINDLFKDPEEWLLKRIESMLARFW